MDGAVHRAGVPVAVPPGLRSVRARRACIPPPCGLRSSRQSRVRVVGMKHRPAAALGRIARPAVRGRRVFGGNERNNAPHSRWWCAVFWARRGHSVLAGSAARQRREIERPGHQFGRNQRVGHMTSGLVSAAPRKVSSCCPPTRREPTSHSALRAALYSRGWSGANTRGAPPWPRPKPLPGVTTVPAHQLACESRDLTALVLLAAVTVDAVSRRGSSVG